MKVASVSEAKNTLSSLVDLVRAGETAVIADRGTPVARLEAVTNSEGLSGIPPLVGQDSSVAVSRALDALQAAAAAAVVLAEDDMTPLMLVSVKHPAPSRWIVTARGEREHGYAIPAFGQFGTQGERAVLRVVGDRRSPAGRQAGLGVPERRP
ncbi:MAG: type II toxin-antitoxin system Phd/YefM family antitoxin [Acidimicrobiales bacterium]